MTQPVELDEALLNQLSKGQPSKDEIVVRHATTIMRLRAALNEIAAMGPHTAAWSAQTVARNALAETR